MLNIIYNIIGSALLVWYFLSIFIVAAQPTISLQVKIIGECINVLCIVFIFHALFGNPDIDKGVYTIVGLMLLIWYGYYTVVDASGITETNILETLVFTLVDILTFLYVGLYLIDNVFVPYQIKQALPDNSYLKSFLNMASLSVYK